MEEESEMLHLCMAQDEEEIDGEECAVPSLQEFIDIMKESRGRQMHLNYFGDGDDLDLWITVQ